MTEGPGDCPDCGQRSAHRNGWHEGQLKDLPAQGASATLKLRMGRWRCCGKIDEGMVDVQ